MKKILCSLAILCMSLMFVPTVYASEQDQQETQEEQTTEQNPDVIDAPIMSYAKIAVSYSTGIAMEDADTFVIKLKSQASNEIFSFDVDAKALAGKIGKIDLAVGTYTVDSIQYMGFNNELMTQGFAINTQFDVEDDVNSTGTLYLNIGRETAEILQKKTQFFAYYVNGELHSLEEATTEAYTIEELPTEATTEYVPETVTTETSEEATEETADKKKEDNKSDFLKFKPKKLIPIMVFAIFGASIIYLLKRMGKL